MSEIKVYSRKKHALISKMGGCIRSDLIDGAEVLVDECDLDGTKLINKAIEDALYERGLVRYINHPILSKVSGAGSSVVPMDFELKLGNRPEKVDRSKAIGAE